MADLAARLAPDVADWLRDHALLLPAEVLTALAGRTVPTGVLGVADRPLPAEQLAALRQHRGPAPVVALEAPRHPGNLGAAIRVAAAAGAAGVVTTGSADPWHPHAVSGSAGLHFALPVARLEGPDDIVGLGRPLVVLDPAGVPLRPGRVPHGAVLAVGTERDGVSAELRDRAAVVVALPMRPGVSSLNLATAVAAALYSLGPWV